MSHVEDVRSHIPTMKPLDQWIIMRIRFNPDKAKANLHLSVQISLFAILPPLE